MPLKVKKRQTLRTGHSSRYGSDSTLSFVRESGNTGKNSSYRQAVQDDFKNDAVDFYYIQFLDGQCTHLGEFTKMLNVFTVIRLNEFMSDDRNHESVPFFYDF